ncbi:MAG TPA: type II secretion system minor pseudopilin GspJ [Casimicrobiaceae bacterium]|nr:type II secretion system minor pseudopilin GspJ [Casimicrobiaceae bacterium]
MNARGFTLLEVLIAIAIVATMATLGYRALDSLSESEARLSAESAHWGELDAFFARMEADLRQAVPRSARLGAARLPAWLGTIAASDGNSVLEFSRAGPEFNVEPGSAGQRLGYRLREGVVEVLYWPSYDRPSDLSPVSYTLLGDVARLRLAYLTTNGAWVEAWPAAGEPELPRAVSVQLTLASGDSIERWFALR